MVAMPRQEATSESADGHEVAQPPRVQPRSPVLRVIELQQRLGITFNDPQLLARALMIGEGSVQEHLRLAYLGDAALGYLLKDRLLDDADASPSVLTNNYIQQSSNQTLGRVGAELGLAAYPMDGDGRKVEGIESDLQEEAEHARAAADCNLSFRHADLLACLFKRNACRIPNPGIRNARMRGQPGSAVRND